MFVYTYLVEKSFVVVCPCNAGEFDPLQFVRQQLLVTHSHHLYQREREGGVGEGGREGGVGERGRGEGREGGMEGGEREGGRGEGGGREV